MTTRDWLIFCFWIAAAAVVVVATRREARKAKPASAARAEDVASATQATEEALRRIAAAPRNDTEWAIYLAATFVDYLYNEGLDAFLSSPEYEDKGLGPFTAALSQLGEENVPQILRRAERLHQRFRDEEERDTSGPDSREGQTRFEAYLEAISACEAEIDLEPDLEERLERFAAAHPVRRTTDLEAAPHA